MSVLAKRYGEGLFSLALEKNKVAEYREQIDFVKVTFDESNVLPFIKSYKVSKELKNASLFVVKRLAFVTDIPALRMN